VTPEDAARDLAAAAARSDEGGLVAGALAIARLEHPSLDVAPSLARLTRLGALATARLERLGPDAAPEDRVATLSRLLFEDERFRGNEDRYDDPRNSCLNDVLERRTGIPISLSVVFLDVAHRAGVHAEGVNFPGHFLVRCRLGRGHGGQRRELIVDPFGGGRVLDDNACRDLLRQRVGEDVAFDRRMLAPASTRQVLTRMLVNLKRLYVTMRSFEQARAAASLLLALDPLAVTELRDRGLLSYHLGRHHAALTDLEAYLLTRSRGVGDADHDDEDEDEDEASEYKQLWEHVKALRRRIASFN
jgi:regulator of sirC expression with transglutaminase-like and TPR domain